MSDRRRLLGPSNTIIPSVGISSNYDLIEVEKTDNRSIDQIRKFFLKTSSIENANGSAYLEVGNTIIQASIFGPRPIHGSFVNRASLSVECKFLPYINQPGDSLFNSQDLFNNNSNGFGKTELTNIEQKISSYIETCLLPSIILEKYPKSTLDIFISIISIDETSKSNASLLNLINWIVNCSSLALVDAGIELKDIVTSGQVRLSNNEIIMDPILPGVGVDALISFMNLRNDEIVGIWLEGDDELNDESLDKIIKGCNEMSKKIRANINSYLLKNAQNV